ncbi:MAG: NusA-like transcription termination signal-binding factor [Thermoprotei archaeon]|nr:MAG: NusA-like transcription termination signal-binding factor [Thermoprotei archaeon]
MNSGINNKPQIKLTAEEFRYIALLHELTNVFVRDCIVDSDNNRIIYLVDPRDIGRAIGPRGVNVQRLRKLLNRDIEIVGYSDSLEEQVKYALAPAKVREVRLVNRPGGKRVIYASVDPSDKGIAIGKNGRNVARATLILKRYFGIDSVIIV